jgi:oxygen-dependent protoporphyrinogen oxidase
MSAGDGLRVLVVGGGITGLAAAEALVADGADVTVREASASLGGKIRTSTFAGLAIDEGADAFLARTPEAVELAGRVGLAGLTSPTDATAAVWHHGLHKIPSAIVLGVPAGLRAFATTGLLSWRGKLRAGCEPFLPRTPTTDDVLGAFVRRRFGDEVHERLVDALVGSIYATDTDNASLGAVPQLAELAAGGRSLLLTARSTRARASGRPNTGPLFATPLGGVGALVDATAAAVRAGGGDVRTSSPVVSVERDDATWVVDGERFDAVALSSPPRATAILLAGAVPEAGRLLSRIEYADVIIVTMKVPAGSWPDRLRGMSGYLVPKPVQRLVTAASFGSQKWSHWRPADGTQILRVSLGRDGLGVDHLDDDAAVAAAVDEVGRHLALDLQPSAVRVSRWRDAFPQYRPHHLDLVHAVESALPAGLAVAGAGYHGIGIPACIRQARRIADLLLRRHVEGIQ